MTTAVWHYLAAKRSVIDAGFAEEISWQARVGTERVSEVSFIEQAAWVVLSAGMSERSVRASFPRLRSALHGFAATAIEADPECLARALDVFNHRPKIEAILRIAAYARIVGDEELERVIQEGDIDALMELPYIGPVTVRHLLKNLGAPCAKPDRHLQRLADAFDSDVDSLCDEISRYIDEPMPVVDVVLWRWSLLHAGECRGPCDGKPHLNDRRDEHAFASVSSSPGRVHGAH